MAIAGTTRPAPPRGRPRARAGGAMTDDAARAPGAPGAPPTWSSSEKDAVGTSHFSSRVWFTVGHGILNEVYWPRVDRPQVRDLGFIVADDAGFWSEVKRDAARDVRSVAPGVPAIIATHTHPRYTLTLRICADDHADVVHIEARLDDPRDAIRSGPRRRTRSGSTRCSPRTSASAASRQQCVGGHVQGAADALRAERCVGPRARLGPGPDPPERGLRGGIGRLAGLRDERPDDVDVRGHRCRQRGGNDRAGPRRWRRTARPRLRHPARGGRPRGVAPRSPAISRTPGTSTSATGTGSSGR